MINVKSISWRTAGLLMVLSLAAGVTTAGATPVSLELTGSIFGVTDPSDVFATESLDTYSLFLTYDPDLLPGAPLGDITIYETMPGETSITVSFESSGGDVFSSDNSFPIEIGVRNTPDFDIMTPGSGQDRFTLKGRFDAVTTFNLVLLESLGSNPLSSNDLPSGPFGGGPGTWSVSELDIDRTDLFANISGSVSNIEAAAVPEPATILLVGLGLVGLAGYRARRAKA